MKGGDTDHLITAARPGSTGRLCLLIGLCFATVGCAELLGLEEGELQGACQDDRECAPGFICWRDHCRTQCADDDGCADGERCLFGRLAAACEPLDLGCDDDTLPCPRGTVCEAARGPACYSTCERDADCQPSYRCIDRVCLTDDPTRSPPQQGDAGGLEAPGSEPAPGVPTEASACNEEGKLGCMGDGLPSRLVCERGKWAPGESCQDGQLCDRRDGRCASIEPDCADREPEEIYCYGRTLITCGPDRVTIERVACPGACVASEGGAGCASVNCGDGIQQPGEACDDGDQDSDNACTALCKPARCGDGFVLRGIEECDDGNDDDGDQCPSTCKPARCGDGFVLSGTESCDDGNTNDDDACDSRCKRPGCGDGTLQPGEQCDDGNTQAGDGCSDRCTPEPAQVAIGYQHICVRFENGRVKCWGDNPRGQLGLDDRKRRGDGAGEMGENLPLLNLGSDLQVADLISGDQHTCAVMTDGRVKCWGGNYHGQLGLGDRADRGDGQDANRASISEMGDRLPFVDLGADRRASALALGNGWTCAILDDGRVRCFGYNLEGELGNGDTATRGEQSGDVGDGLPTVDLGTGVTAIAISATWAHTCIVTDAGKIKCWGFNFDGELGLGDTITRGDRRGEMGDALPFVDLGSDFVATALVTGRAHNCALSNTGRVKCWGSAVYGQLGQGDTRWRGDGAREMGEALPYVNLGGTVTQLAAGLDHTCALLDDGRVKCWGYNEYGQLGLGDVASRGDQPGEMGDNLPAVDVGAGRKVQALAARFQATCVLLDDAKVKCWGWNNSGQLGLGDTARRGDGPGEMGDALPAIVLW